MKPWYIKDTDFTQRVSEQDMNTFLRVCPQKPYQKGAMIFHTGDQATDLHVIAKGQVKLVTMTPSGGERILAILGPNDFFGEAFLSANAYYRVDAIALTEVVSCPISRKQFTNMAVEAPNFTLTFAEILAQHMFDCREQLSSSYAPVKSRVAHVLCDQAERFGKNISEDWVKLSTELKHEEIASMITATRVSVSMAIAELRNDGFLEGTRGEYILNTKALSQDFES